ncbi:hypothetical protein [Aurantimonas sp. Leaf443]|nr:hypothetical protein [Aurantimonas sp. Leaf443]
MSMQRNISGRERTARRFNEDAYSVIGRGETLSAARESLFEASAPRRH